MFIAADTSWYNDIDTEFILYTPEQLVGLSELSKTNTFFGKTIKLGADMRLNIGKSSDWSNMPPENVWQPIGSDSNVCFNGTFDGCGHVIAGLYNRSLTGATLGLFGFTNDATIKNVCITNSYFRNDVNYDYHTHTGAVVASAFGGLIENVYTDAILSGGSDIGLIAFFRNLDITIKNCWFDGLIIPPENAVFYAGGLLGRGFYASSGPLNGALNIDNCLFTGTINGGTNAESSSYVGGLVGMAPTGLDTSDKTNIHNCVSCGEIITSATGVGSLIGTCSWRTKYTTISNLYVAEECYKNSSGELQAIGSGRDNPQYIVGTYTVLPKKDMIGENAKVNMSGLDYDVVWTSVSGSTPELRMVTKTPYNNMYTIEYSTLIDSIDRIRKHNRTEKSYTSLEIPDAIDTVYEAGKAAGGGGYTQEELDKAVEDAIEEGYATGNQWWVDFIKDRTDLNMFFKGGKFETIPDGIDFSNITSMTQTFYMCPNLKQLPHINSTNCTYFSYAFGGVGSVKNPLEEISVDVRSANDVEQMFGSARIRKVKLVGNLRDVTSAANMIVWSAVEEIHAYEDESMSAEIPLDLSNNTKTSVFAYANQLKYVRVAPGSIKVSQNIANSNLLDDGTSQSLIDGLADLTGQTAQTITWHKDMEAKLTDAQKATITAKNWIAVYQ